jgi:hypothetical protein
MAVVQALHIPHYLAEVFVALCIFVNVIRPFHKLLWQAYKIWSLVYHSIIIVTAHRARTFAVGKFVRLTKP